MTVTETQTPCMTYTNVFLHPLLDDTQPASKQSKRREQAMMRAQADKLCAGCSVSTVKRHLRRIERDGLAPTPRKVQPSEADVMRVADEVKGGARRRVAA